MLAYALKEKESCLEKIKRLEKEIEALYEKIKAVQLEKRKNELRIFDFEKIIAETASDAPHD
jgi:uncharacterized protein (UPF0335 family)